MWLKIAIRTFNLTIVQQNSDNEIPTLIDSTPASEFNWVANVRVIVIVFKLII